MGWATVGGTGWLVGGVCSWLLASLQTGTKTLGQACLMSGQLGPWNRGSVAKTRFKTSHKNMCGTVFHGIQAQYWLVCREGGEGLGE